MKIKNMIKKRKMMNNKMIITKCKSIEADLMIL
jgi:hypothetical protein